MQGFCQGEDVSEDWSYSDFICDVQKIFPTVIFDQMNERKRSMYKDYFRILEASYKPFWFVFLIFGLGIKSHNK